MTMMSATIPYDGTVVVTATTTTPAPTTAPVKVHNDGATGNDTGETTNAAASGEVNTNADAQERTKSRASPPLNPLWAQMTGLRLSPGWRAAYNPLRIGADKPLSCRLADCETFYWNRFDAFSFNPTMIHPQTYPKPSLYVTPTLTQP